MLRVGAVLRCLSTRPWQRAFLQCSRARPVPVPLGLACRRFTRKQFNLLRHETDRCRTSRDLIPSLLVSSVSWKCSWPVCIVNCPTCSPGVQSVKNVAASSLACRCIAVPPSDVDLQPFASLDHRYVAVCANSRCYGPTCVWVSAACAAVQACP